MPKIRIREVEKEVKDMPKKEETPEKDIQGAPEDATVAEAEEIIEEQDDLAVLKAQLQAAEQKRDEYLDMAQRLQAEFENYKRRNRTAVADAYQTAADETICAFLPVLDNLQRALNAAKDTEDVEDIVTGVEMVIKQFTDLLAQMDVTPIEAVGQCFDPQCHHAVMRVDAGEQEQPDTVVEELLKGYARKDKVIRCSMVKVAN